jgi:hypothetical protein
MAELFWTFQKYELSEAAEGIGDVYAALVSQMRRRAGKASSTNKTSTAISGLAGIRRGPFPRRGSRRPSRSSCGVHGRPTRRRGPAR